MTKSRWQNNDSSFCFAGSNLHPPRPNLEKPFWRWGAYERGGAYKIRAGGGASTYTPPPLSPLKMPSGQNRGDGVGGVKNDRPLFCSRFMPIRMLRERHLAAARKAGYMPSNMAWAQLLDQGSAKRTVVPSRNIPLHVSLEGH